MPLPPCRVQCPGGVCASLAAGLGGRGRCWFSLLPLGSSLPSRPWRCVLRVVPPGCPFPSPASTPFHAVFAFRGLGPVALRVRAGCLLPVCALVLLRRTPPPPQVGLVRALRAVPVQGAGRDVPGGSSPTVFPAPVRCIAFLALRGVARFLLPLAWLGVARPPAGRPGFACWLCALWGRSDGARGAGHPLCVERSELGAVPRPTARRMGPRQGPATHWLLMRGGGGRGAPHLLHSAHSCVLALRDVGAAGGHPGGCAACLVVGCPG